VIHLLGSSRGHGGRVQGRRRRIGVAERRFYYTGRLRGGSYELRAYTRVYARACTRARDCVAGGCAEERFRLGIIRIRNLFLPRGSTTTTSSYILLFSRRSPPPAPRPPPNRACPIRGHDQMHTSSHFHGGAEYKPRCQVLSRWLRYFPELYGSIPCSPDAIRNAANPSPEGIT